MSSILLYSTNVYLKWWIHSRCHQRHFVWCSEQFDCKKLGEYHPDFHTPPSSNPADLYRRLQKDTQGRDQHSAKIAEQRASLAQLAVKWFTDGKITNQDEQDILYSLKTADFVDWHPLIYVIPMTISLRPRIQKVPLERCAGRGAEYTIADLRDDEFDRIEL